VTAAYLSQAAVSIAECDAGKSALFVQMSEAAEEQVALLAREIGHTPGFTPPFRARLVAGLLRILSPQALRMVLSASKVRGISVYAGPARRLGHPVPMSSQEVGRSHRSTGGGTLRAGVFGANDGLVSNTCLVMGVAGAAASADIILLSGFAGLPCRRVLDGCRRIHFDAVAARDVRISDKLKRMSRRRDKPVLGGRRAANIPD
jgi:hypothetical protein